MPVDPVLKYLKDTELAFGSLSSGYIERYEEEFLTPERVNLRIRVRFSKGQMLEWNEAIIIDDPQKVPEQCKYFLTSPVNLHKVCATFTE